MKKITLSMIALATIGTSLMAGGDIIGEDTTVVIEEVKNDSSYYIGGAFSFANIDATRTFDNGNIIITNEADLGNYNAIMLQAGYNFNKYIALEGRYWFGLGQTFSDYNGDSFDLDIHTWGIYVKPQYPITDNIKVYGLLGYANSGEDGAAIYNTGLDGLSWGLGGSYEVAENIEVFIDYVDMYNDEERYGVNNKDDIDINSWNFGVSYKF